MMTVSPDTHTKAHLVNCSAPTRTAPTRTAPTTRTAAPTCTAVPPGRPGPTRRLVSGTHGPATGGRQPGRTPRAATRPSTGCPCVVVRNGFHRNEVRSRKDCFEGRGFRNSRFRNGSCAKQSSKIDTNRNRHGRHADWQARDRGG